MITHQRDEVGVRHEIAARLHVGAGTDTERKTGIPVHLGYLVDAGRIFFDENGALHLNGNHQLLVGEPRSLLRNVCVNGSHREEREVP